LPSIERLAAAASGPRSLAVSVARDAVEEARAAILRDGGAAPTFDELSATVAERVAGRSESTLREVVNATGIVLHTNLGRAPLAPAAAAAAARVAGGYSNLEYDLDDGRRGSRHAHVEGLLCDLTGCEAGFAVNNNAAAVLLALTAVAAGREVITSRGELIEIGGSFRIPEILAQSGASLVEVGTTNRTRIGDYTAAVGPATGAILRVHQSNFRTVGFTEQATLEELCALGRERGITVIDDLGSGAIEPLGDEPVLRHAIAAGTDLVCASADKLLGGPQAGIVVGTAAAVERCRNHPLARALRLDKMQIAALEATLRIHRDGGGEAIPALAMLALGEAELGVRARRLAELAGPRARVVPSAGRAGGGTLPLAELPGPVCEIDPGAEGAERLAARFRAATPPIVARVSEGRLVLDPRTLLEGQVEQVGAAAGRILA
jgi:L-seryl-tRNA(Ser) seleniumtransferase